MGIVKIRLKTATLKGDLERPQLSYDTSLANQSMITAINDGRCL